MKSQMCRGVRFSVIINPKPICVCYNVPLKYVNSFWKSHLNILKLLTNTQVIARQVF